MIKENNFDIKNTLKILLLSFITALLPIIIFISSPHIMIMGIFGDLFVPLEVGYRTLQGQVPHKDFHTSIGPLYVYMQAWPWMFFKNHDPNTWLMANLPVLLILIVGMISIQRKMHWLWIVFSLTILSYIAMTPQMSGRIDLEINHLANYNRACWALLGLSFFILWPHKKIYLFEGLLLGVILSALFFIKVSFFLPLFLSCFFFLLFKKYRLPVILSFIFFGFSILVSHFYFGIFLPYMADIHMAIKASESVSRLDKLFLNALSNYAIMIFVPFVFIYLYFAENFKLKLIVQKYFENLSFILFMFFVSFVASSQVHDLFVPTFWIIALFCVIKMEFKNLRILSFIVLVMSSILFINEGRGLIMHFYLANLSDAEKEKMNFYPVPIKNSNSKIYLFIKNNNNPDHIPLYFEDRLQLLTPPEYYKIFKDTLSSLNEDFKGISYLDLNFSNPWPYLLQTESPKGWISWAHYGRSLSKESHPDWDNVFVKDRLFFISKIQRDIQRQRMLIPTYMEELEKRGAKLVGENDHYYFYMIK